MKVLLEYNEATGELKDTTGTTITSWLGLKPFGKDKDSVVDKTIELVRLGLSPDDIIKLKHQGLIGGEL